MGLGSVDDDGDDGVAGGGDDVDGVVCAAPWLDGDVSLDGVAGVGESMSDGVGDVVGGVAAGPLDGDLEVRVKRHGRWLRWKGEG